MKIRVIVRKEGMVYVMLAYKLVNTSIRLTIIFFKIVFLLKTSKLDYYLAFLIHCISGKEKQSLA